MPPWQVRGRQPASLALMYEGAQARDERTCERLAWAMTHLLNGCGQLTKPVRYWDLLAELIGAEAAARKHRASVEARLAARQRRREGTE